MSLATGLIFDGAEVIRNMYLFHATVVFEDYMYIPSRLTGGYRLKLVYLCHMSLFNRRLTPGTIVFPTDSKVAVMFGIKAIIISKCIFHSKEIKETITVDAKATFKVIKVQSVSHFKLRLDEEQIPLGGLDKEFAQLKVLLEFNIKGELPQCHKTVGVLLHGPPGCGKTSLAKALAKSVKGAFLKVESIDVTKSESGAGADALREIFKKAAWIAKQGPVVLYLDELDKLCPASSTASMGSRQFTSALVTELDGLRGDRLTNLIVVAETNAIFNVNSALRRPGRFEREILLNVPSQQQRQAILEVQEQALKLKLAKDVSEEDMAMMTPGYVGADLKALCEEAVNQAYTRLSQKDVLWRPEDPESQESPEIQKDDFMAALHRVTPSLKKGLSCYVDLTGVQWEEIGGLEDIKVEIQQAIEWPLLHPEALRRMDLQPTKGLLLYGPPGCCKTTLVRAAATSSHVTFLALNGAQVYSPYVGESERIISEAFQKARALSPSILFFDEIDALVGKRGSGGGQSRVQERILATMLNEMDGIGTRLDRKTHASGQQDNVEKEVLSDGKDEGLKDQASSVDSAKQDEGHRGTRSSDVDKSRVIVIGATNRPDMLDAAILRPGRLDRHIYVPPPDKEGRQSIFKLLFSKMPVVDVDIDALGDKTEGFSGADIKHLCREAALDGVKRTTYFEPWTFVQTMDITNDDFSTALERVKPSLSKDVLQQYCTKTSQLGHNRE